ncbi:MAG: hypothetical protein ACI9YL_000864 [Luteibaculaceae bacterium]|jgi:hypothetical protein
MKTQKGVLGVFQGFNGALPKLSSPPEFKVLVLGTGFIGKLESL